MKVNLFYSLLYNLLLTRHTLRDSKTFFGRCWRKVWELAPKKYKGAVSTKIHGFEVKVNNGNSYPLYARLFPKYNNPLLQLVCSAFNFHKRKLTIIDVGSATGDTNLLLLRNLPNSIEKLYCVEGDSVFFAYLEENKKHFPTCQLYNALLSDFDHKEIRGLIKTHLGTASAMGRKKKNSISLDSLLLHELPEKVDLLKIDVDGFDGKILQGSKMILKTFKPLLIFEWHPILISQTANSFFEAFELLYEFGYTRFLWYTKFGDFSHFDFNSDLENRKNLVEICLRNSYEYDWHYDIIAIHRESEINFLELAELKEAKLMNSRF